MRQVTMRPVTMQPVTMRPVTMRPVTMRPGDIAAAAAMITTGAFDASHAF